MVSLATQSMVPLMMDLGLRYRAWHGAMVDLGVFVALIFYALGSILLVLQQPPGSWLGAGVLNFKSIHNSSYSYTCLCI